MSNTYPIFKYLRFDDRFPHVWCSGCGIGVTFSAMIRAIDKLKIPKDNLVLVSGIGCSSRLPGYIDTDSLHTLHGRALPAALGVKFYKPEMKVIVVSGDGDALAIGGNHFIHACRRNIDITLILINNFNYGMTGGQASPTTPHEKYTKTTPYGERENFFDACELASSAGATFVARTTVYHVVQLEKYIEKAIMHKGFSVLDVISNCHVLYGRFNKMGEPTLMLQWMKENSIPLSKAKDMKPEELEGKIVTGIFKEVEEPEFCDNYNKLVEELR